MFKMMILPLFISSLSCAFASSELPSWLEGNTKLVALEEIKLSSPEHQLISMTKREIFREDGYMGFEVVYNYLNSKNRYLTQVTVCNPVSEERFTCHFTVYNQDHLVIKDDLKSFERIPQV